MVKPKPKRTPKILSNNFRHLIQTALTTLKQSFVTELSRMCYRQWLIKFYNKINEDFFLPAWYNVVWFGQEDSLESKIHWHVQNMPSCTNKIMTRQSKLPSILRKRKKNDAIAWPETELTSWADMLSLCVVVRNMFYLKDLFHINPSP